MRMVPHLRAKDVRSLARSKNVPSALAAAARKLVMARSGGGGNKRPKWARLLPDFLRPAGYRNYHSGKWHIDGPVLAAGFDRSRRVNNQGNFFTNRGNLVDDRPVRLTGDESDYYCTTATADQSDVQSLGCGTLSEQDVWGDDGARSGDSAGVAQKSTAVE